MVLIVFISFMYVVRYSNSKETRIIADSFIVNQKWIAKNPLILYIEHRGTEARRNKYIEKVKTIEPDFYSVNSVLSKICVFVSLCSIPFFRKPILFYYNLRFDNLLSTI